MERTSEAVDTCGANPGGHIPVAVEPAVGKPTEEDVAKLAHQFWDERGRQDGSQDANWSEAERQLRAIGPRR